MLEDDSLRSLSIDEHLVEFVLGIALDIQAFFNLRLHDLLEPGIPARIVERYLVQTYISDHGFSSE